MFDLADVVEGARKAAVTDVEIASDDELLACVGAVEVARCALDAAQAHARPHEAQRQRTHRAAQG